MRRLVVLAIVALAASSCRRDEPSPAAPSEQAASDEGTGAAAAEVSPGSGDAAENEPAASDAVAEETGTEGQPVLTRSRQPCTITTQTLQADAEPNCYEVPELQVGGHPQAVCVTQDEPRTYTYDFEGRVVAQTGGWTYAWNRDTRGGAVAPDGTMVGARSDARGRVERLGETSWEWDDHGRVLHRHDGDMTISRVYRPDGTYELEHDYPDTDEFCEATVTAVTGDPLRPDSQTFGGCEIYERPRTLTYTRDEHGRIVGVDIDTGSDGTIEARATVGYGCW